MRSPRRVLCMALLLVVLAGGALYVNYQGVGGDMTRNAEAFVDTLSEQQRERTVLRYNDPKRLDWHFIPKNDRKGLQIKDMTPEQRKAAHALLKSALSQIGYDKAVVIMELEKILHELEKARDGGNIRDPERYYFTVFGKPASEGKWGLSVEGHHLSLNFAVEDGRVLSTTPTFFGANPAEVKQAAGGGPKPGMRVLAKEEDLAFKLLAALDEKQRGIAVVAEKAPRDIRAAAEAQAPDARPQGLPVKGMTAAQAGLLRELIQVYADNMPADIAGARMKSIDEAGWEGVYFAWAGANKPGVGHQYYIQGPTFLIELNNTQTDASGNRANHIHSVWRDMRGDFGIPRAASNGKAAAGQ
ncbi:MAG: DUF3500 domain-containing protein [Pirellulales bacterium]